MSTSILTGTFGASGAGASKQFRDDFNISLWGTFVATVALEKSFDIGVADGSSTWIPVAKDASGAAASWTAPTGLTIREPELGVKYRLNCTSFTSGVVNWRLSQ